MKTRINTRPRGSVLLVSLVMVSLILTSLATYLLLVANENQTIIRSQKWNTGVPVMEAGVEEAMTQIHYCGITNLSGNNWALGADGNYHKTRYVGVDGSYCNIAIQPVNPPVIYSTAYISVPVSFQHSYYISNNFVAREVRVGTTHASPWGGGLTAKGTISFPGNGSFDSFNSADGPYNPAIHGTNGVVLSNTNVVGAISSGGNGVIYGTAVTGPGGSVTASVVGSTANDANFQFNDVAAPYTSGTPPLSGSLLGTNYAYLLNASVSSSYYYRGDLTMSGGTMEIIGNVTLFVTGAFNISGQASVTITPGSSLTLYVGGNVSIAGYGAVNLTGLAANCNIQALPTCTSVQITGNGTYVGTINAPEASVLLGGNGGTYGACIAHDITVTGGGGAHYDGALANDGGYVVASWNEIAPQ